MRSGRDVVEGRLRKSGLQHSGDTPVRGDKDAEDDDEEASMEREAMAEAERAAEGEEEQDSDEVYSDGGANADRNRNDGSAATTPDDHTPQPSEASKAFLDIAYVQDRKELYSRRDPAASSPHSNGTPTRSKRRSTDRECKKLRKRAQGLRDKVESDAVCLSFFLGDHMCSVLTCWPLGGQTMSSWHVRRGFGLGRGAGLTMKNHYTFHKVKQIVARRSLSDAEMVRRIREEIGDVDELLQSKLHP